MSRRQDAPSVRIIDNTRYVLEKRHLLCEIFVSIPGLIVDINAKKTSLYYPKGKAFILETVSDVTGAILETKIVSMDEAREFMNKHPEGIKEKVYIKYFGEPKEL